MRNQWEHMSDHHTFQGQSVAANTVGKGGKTLPIQREKNNRKYACQYCGKICSVQ